MMLDTTKRGRKGAIFSEGKEKKKYLILKKTKSF